jgi:hypothetical protein
LSRLVWAVILPDGGRDGEADAGAEINTEDVTRSCRLYDRFSPEGLQTMIDLYRSGTTAKHVVEKFGVTATAST